MVQVSAFCFSLSSSGAIGAMTCKPSYWYSSSKSSGRAFGWWARDTTQTALGDVSPGGLLTTRLTVSVKVLIAKGFNGVFIYRHMLRLQMPLCK